MCVSEPQNKLAQGSTWSQEMKKNEKKSFRWRTSGTSEWSLQKMQEVTQWNTGEHPESESAEEDREVEVRDYDYASDVKLEGGCGAEHLPDEAVNDEMEEVEVEPENPEEKRRTMRLTMGRLLWRWRMKSSTATWIQIPTMSTDGNALEMQLVWNTMW